MADKEQTKGVVVKSGYEGRVGLAETHPDHKAHGHKDGEIFVKDEPVRVALTPAVAMALKVGNLVETDEKPVKPPQLPEEEKKK